MTWLLVVLVIAASATVATAWVVQHKRFKESRRVDAIAWESSKPPYDYHDDPPGLDGPVSRSVRELMATEMVRAVQAAGALPLVAPPPVVPVSTMLESESFGAWTAAQTDLTYHEWLEQELAREELAHAEAEAIRMERDRCESVAYLEDAERGTVAARKARERAALAVVAAEQQAALEKELREDQARRLAAMEIHEREESLAIRRLVMEKLKALPAWCFNAETGRWCAELTGERYMTLEKIVSELGPRWIEKERQAARVKQETELRERYPQPRGSGQWDDYRIRPYYPNGRGWR